MKSLSLKIALSGFTFVQLSRAIRLPIQRVQTRSAGSEVCSTNMSKRNTNTGLTNTLDDFYTAEVKVGQTSKSSYALFQVILLTKI